MKILLGFLFLIACVASWGDEDGPHHGGGVVEMGNVGKFKWVEAEQVVLPDLDFGKSDTPNSGTAGKGGEDIFSYRKAHPEIANVFATGAGPTPGKPGASAGGNGEDASGAGNGQPDPSKLLWKESSTALVDGKPQLLQFGYDEQNNIRGVKFADRPEPVMMGIDPSVPKRLRTAGGEVDTRIAGRQVTSIKADTPKCQG